MICTHPHFEFENVADEEVPQDGVSFIRFTDRKILEETAIAEIERDIAAILQSSQTFDTVMFDFERLDHLSSAAIGSLQRLAEMAHRCGKTLFGSALAKQPMNLFVITDSLPFEVVTETPSRQFERISA